MTTPKSFRLTGEILNDERALEVLHQAISRSHALGEQRMWTMFRAMSPKLESPIELLFAYALCAMLPEHYYNYGEDEATIMRLAQAQVPVPDSSFRVDFMIYEYDMGKNGNLMPIPWRSAVAVELDGHDFHERTKEQAKRDKSKDRLLQMKGFLVARFTGSEVWKDPFGCVDSAFDLLNSAARKRPDATD